MKTTVLYRRTRVPVDMERSPVCEACGRAGKIDMHHYRYAYSTDEVRKNRSLVLNNTIQLCMKCHGVADSIRDIEENADLAEKVIALLNQKRKPSCGKADN